MWKMAHDFLALPVLAVLKKRQNAEPPITTSHLPDGSPVYS
jgi:hypothetical protein